jgi:PelA/Pel-15E family pectate lyase
MRTLLLLLLFPLHPAIVGVSKPAQSLTEARVATLPLAQQPPWRAYLQRSQHQQQLDRAALAQERAHLTGPIPPPPHESPSARSIPTGRDPAFYRSPEARNIAETILSFQIPNGGWSKNLDMSAPPRLPGQGYTPNNISKYLIPDDFDAPHDPSWNYVGTLDNDATTTELHFLARMSSAYPAQDGEAYRAAFLRGIAYLLYSQYPNGGWPQVWPLEGGYHDAITFNDNAVTESASLLTAATQGEGDFAFVPAPVRAQAHAAATHALDCILATQVVIHGQETIWAQQHDPLTLKPVAGRNFEPAALSAGESADILIYLMQLPSPTPQVRASIEAGIAWLKAHAIQGESWTGGRNTPPSPTNPAGGRHLEYSPGAPAIWPRYTSIETGKPIFGDRDKTIHDSVMDLTLERRNGYAWYSPGPQAALDAYATWMKEQPRHTH